MSAEYDLKLYYGDAVLRIEEGAEVQAEGSEDCLRVLRERAAELREGPFGVTRENIEYDQATEDRLEDLGYL